MKAREDSLNSMSRPVSTDDPMGEASKLCALVPIKSLNTAKSRLSSVLSLRQRSRLAVAMFEDVIDALAESRQLGLISVLTDDADLQALASDKGCAVYVEDSTRGYRENLAHAAADLEAKGFGTLLHVAADLPHLCARDVGHLLGLHRGGVTVCVATEDDGTNGLVCSPPTAIVPSFGAPSRERHLAAARRAGIAARSVTVSGFARDLDRPSDLHRLGVEPPAGARTRAALRALARGDGRVAGKSSSMAAHAARRQAQPVECESSAWRGRRRCRL